MIFHLIPHTHWDREWYLPAAALTARLVPVLDDLLDLLDDPDGGLPTFLLDGQTVLLEDYLRARPEHRERVARLVSAGRLQTGPWYVLADELTPSGESLIRNLLIGGAQAGRLGRRLDVAYSPDAFGHPAAFPALAAEFGLRSAVLWRGLLPGPDDGDLFRWRGAAGAEILVYQLPRDGYEIGAELPGAGPHLARRWRVVRNVLTGRARSRHVAVFVGADHHAPHPALARLREDIAGLEPGHEVRISRLDDYLAAAREESHDVATIAGELRWSYGYTWTLQGVHGTRLPLKRRNARAEAALERIAEPLAAAAALRGGRDRRALLGEAWRLVVQGHFHDAICGCSHDAVALDVERRLEHATAITREIARGSLTDLVGHDPDAARESGAAPRPALAVWNPAPRRRAGVVVADLTFFRHDVLVGPPGARTIRTGPGYRALGLRDGSGRLLPVQLLGLRRGVERIDAVRHYPDADAVDIARVAVRMPDVSGLGIELLEPVEGGTDPVEHGATVEGRRLSNGLVTVVVESDGTISLTDDRTGERYRGLLRLESEPDTGDAYTFSTSRRVRPRRSRAKSDVRMLANGPLVAALQASWADLDAAFLVTVILHANEPFARVIVDLTNQARDRRLRAFLPTGLAGQPCEAGAPFAREQRHPLEGAVSGYPAERPVGTFPAQRFAGVARGDRGIAVLAPGHFEGEWLEGGELAITLLRSIGRLSRDDLPERPGHAGWPTDIPGAQCLGPDRSEWVIAPIVEGALRGDGVHRLWEDAFAGLTGRWIRDAVSVREPGNSVELEGNGLIFSAMKPAESGSAVILRCYNVGNAATWGAWTIRPAPFRAARARADETVLDELALESGVIRFRAEAGEIVTVVVEGRKDGRTEGRKDGRTGGRKDGRTEGR